VVRPHSRGLDAAGFKATWLRNRRALAGVFVFRDGQFRRVANAQTGTALLDIPAAVGTVFVGEPGLSVVARFDLEQVGKN
jgi:hypothetical protein